MQSVMRRVTSPWTRKQLNTQKSLNKTLADVWSDGNNSLNEVWQTHNLQIGAENLEKPEPQGYPQKM